MEEGSFENLAQYVAVTFKNDDTTMSEFTKDYADDGIFFYTDEEKRRISSASFSGKRMVPSKFGTMVTYLFELAYDLALDRRLNVSRSPGGEGCGTVAFQETGKKKEVSV